jgi:hypothetical protein
VRIILGGVEMIGDKIRSTTRNLTRVMIFGFVAKKLNDVNS